MKSGYDYGHLGTDEYAMSFQMNDNSGRGFWWGDDAHNDNQGAASLTTDGRMTIAKSLSVGEGEAVILPSSTPLYVKGSTSGADVIGVDGINGRLFTVTDDLSNSLFSVNTIAGLPVIEAFADNTVNIGKYGYATTWSTTGFVTMPNSANIYRDLFINGGRGGNFSNRLIIGTDAATYTMQDSNQRPTAYLHGAYPVLTLNHTVSDNTSHGPTIQFTHNTADKQWVIGTNGTGTRLDIGYSTNTNRNPHNGIDDYNGSTFLRVDNGGNIQLGRGNGRSTWVNDTLYVGASDSGDSHMYFGEDSSNWYGLHWYWDSGYTVYLYGRNAGTDTEIMRYTTNSNTYVEWRRNFHMNNYEINYVSQLHFNAGTRFVGNTSSYLNFQTDSTTVGGIIVRDGNSSVRGYADYFDSNGFGLLNSTGNWGIRLNPGNVGTQLFYAGSSRLDTRSGGVGVQGNLYTDNDYGYGLVGVYASTRYQGVFAMGDSYKLLADGTGTGTLYGIAWTHTNVGGQSKSGLGHQALFMDNGVTQTAIGTGIWTNGLITTTSYGTSANWNTAFGWGNHASADYIVKGTQVLSAASWTTATRFGSVGDISQEAGNHALSVRSEAGNDAFMSFHIGSDYAVHFGLDDVTNRLHVGGWSDGAGNKYQIWDSRDFSSTNISNWNTAYGWGNHASAGYITSVAFDNLTSKSSGTGTYQTSGDFRAPIFYDSADTGYYVDPNSESKLRKLWINNGGAAGVSWSTGLNMGDGSNYWNLIQDAGVARQRNFGTGGYDWYNNTASTQLMLLSNAGNLSVSGTISASNFSGSSSGTNTGDQTNISGNAATATNVAWSGVTSKPAGWLDTGALVVDMEPSATAFPSGFYQSYLGAGNPTGTWFNYINVRHSNTGNGHGFQLGMSYYDTNLWFRSYQGGLSPTFSSWSYAISSLNIGSQSVASATTAGSLTSMNISQFTNNSGYITSFTETNTFLGDGGNADTHPGTDRIIFTGQLSTGAPVLGMPATDNSNAILNINRHPGEYNSQLGFSSNGSMYYRSFSAAAINNSQAWRQVWDSGNLTNLNQLSNGPGYITGYTETDTLNSVTTRGASTTNNITIGGLTVSGSLSYGTFTTASNYVTGADNIVLKGNSTGVSGIFFESEKDGTNINHPSDFGFIQYHAYGIGGSSGEANRLVIGVSNDADDIIVLNPVNTNGLVVRVGAGTTEYTVYHSGNIPTWNQNTTGNAATATTAVNADTVDGFHASVAGTANTIPTRNANGYLIPENWIQLNGIYGLYSPTNNAHLRPNPNSYGPWLVTGTRNGWNGIEFDASNGNVSLMVNPNSNTTGFHNNSYGWQFYWEGGTLYCSKNAYGGGTNATVIDSTTIGSQSVAFATTANRLERYGVIYGNNWNDYYLNNRFIVASAHNATGTNKPDTAYNYGSMISYYNSGEDHYQIYVTENSVNSNSKDRKMYYRSGWNGSWGGWRSVVDVYNSVCYIDAAVTATGDITAFSDGRVKENVETLEGALDKTLKLRGVSYNRTDIEDKSTKIGVIAQEILEVVPEVVSQDENGMYAVSYGNITALLIEAIKEQQKQINELKEIINGFTR
jgi:hypothetical protein